MVDVENTFLWGATVSAHAVEGTDFHADWWRWEQRPAHIRGGGTSEVAADHLKRYKTDLELAKKIGLNALQYGVSWARVEPEPGEFDTAALAHYASVFRAMTRQGMTPVCVLQECTLPAWFSKRGGWEHPDGPDHFLAYVKRLYDALGSTCQWWIPHLEPMRWIAMAYGEGCWPKPEQARRASRAIKGMAAAHREVATFLREVDQRNQIGASIYAPRIVSRDIHSPWDKRLEQKQSKWFLETYPDTLCGTDRDAPPFSFIALSSPGQLQVHGALLRPRNGFVQYANAQGVACAPDQAEPDSDTLEEMASHLAPWKVPLLMTGIGVATEDDGLRCHHLLDHVERTLHLRDTGVKVLGFCYNALLDGFAWEQGYQQRYGLVHVDWKSLTRTPNPSAFLYQDIIRTGVIHPGAVSRFAAGWQTTAREVI